MMFSRIFDIVVWMDKKRSISGRVRNKKNIFSVIVSLISFKLSISIHLTRVNCSRLSGLPCCYTPTWWPNLSESWQKIEIFPWSEAWNPPTWGCKSMVEGPTIMLGISSLCYTSIQCQTSTIVAPACCYTPTWWPRKLVWELAEKRDFSLIWGMKPANMGL